MRYRAILAVLSRLRFSVLPALLCQNFRVLKNADFLSRAKFKPSDFSEGLRFILCGCECVLPVLCDSLTAPKVADLVHCVVLAVFLLVAVIVPIPR